MRKTLLILLGASTLFLAGHRANGYIGISYQLQLGNPSNATADTNNHDHYLIQRTVEALDYSDNLGEPVWASWDLTPSDDTSASGRSSSFFTDTNLPPNFYWVTDNDYNGVGNINFNRGHMCPSEDRTDNTTDNDLVFFMSNIIPQAATNNQGVWGNLESDCRTFAQAGNELLIICGPSGFGTNRIPSGKAGIANYTWKIAVVVPSGSNSGVSRINAGTRVIAVKIPNSNSVTSAWQNYVTNAAQIEADAGLTFFSALSAPVASALRYKVDGQTNPAPVITNFSPSSGGAGASIIITGTNFGSALSVSFNGAAAAYSVDSAGQITAQVPTNATPGKITVMTASGTATSAGSFNTAGATAVADLAIISSHGGNFTQGDAADTYTLTVSNAGSSGSSNLVTVTDTLPAGLTATAISGAGWTTNLAALTCTRTDSLGTGASYPPIFITVSVATNAPATVTNSAMVSGGGETNSADDTANDLTTIFASSGGGGVTGLLAGWDISALTGFGPSPFAPTTNATNLTVVGLTRGSGVGLSGTAATNAWGGTGFLDTNSAMAITNNRYATFTITANSGYNVSFNSVSPFNYRRSSTGPTNGLLQYQVGSNVFTDIAPVAYSNSTSSGAALGPIDLTGIAALQNVGAGNNVTFRIVNWGGTSSSGTWYIFNVTNSTAVDFAIQGTVTPTLTPIQSWRQQWFGTTANSGAAADSAIATGNHMPNLLKYALGLNPLTPAANPVVGDITTGYLRLTSPKNSNATDVSFFVELTSGLPGTNWSTNGTVIDQNTSALIQAHDAQPIKSSMSGFMRLRVNGP